MKKSKKLDIVNSFLKYISGFFIIPTIIELYNTENAEGVSWIHVGFFSLWGVWNLYYFWNLDQKLSALANVFLILMNTTWLVMLLYYGT